MIQIGVIGGGKTDKITQDIATEVGREIAKSGNILVCGGLGGVMEASAKGAKEERGITVAILPGIIKDDANKYMDIKIITGMNHARNAIIAWSADAIIAVKGSMGTVSEIALALKMDKPVIVIKNIEERVNMAEISEKFQLQKKYNLHFVEDAKTAVELALKCL
jgi:hypothetical protein